MRRIHMEDGLSLRFPGRGEEFNEGVEIGILAALMNTGLSAFSHWVSTDNLDQARAIAEKFGYRLAIGRVDGILTEVTARSGAVRPKLTLVYSRQETAQNVA